MKETQQSIESWRHETFGEVTRFRIATRALEEMTELLVAMSRGEYVKARGECADVLIVLYGVASALHIDLHSEVNAKMVVNRRRKWKVDGSGCGYHVKGKP